MTSAASYAPFAVGRRLRVVPPDAPSAADGRIDLVMPRGAFGSGEHETTASCLELLEELGELHGSRVLDLGSGTGILSIAALRLGARSAVLVDIDAAAVCAARTSCALNAVEQQVQHVHGELTQCDTGGFDVALANLYGDLLLRLADELASRVRPGGALLLSGMLWEHAYPVEHRFAALGCAVERRRWLEDFVTLQLRLRHR